MIVYKYILLLAVLALLGGCGLVQKVAVGTTADILFDGTKEIETESNWELFKQGVPGNLKMMEGMLYLEPKNKKLLAGLTKGYAGYAFAVNETEYLQDLYTGKSDSSPHKIQLISNYSKALEFGLRFLEQRDVRFDDFKREMNNNNGIYNLLDKELSDSLLDLEGTLFTAQSLGSLIFLQQDSMTMVALLPIVKSMFDWVCSKKPDINYGACDIFYGAYEAGRPKMLGGNPQKGKQIFLDLIKKYKHNWLLRIAYIRFSIIPRGEQEEFQEQMKFFAKVHPMYIKHLGWKPLKTDPPDEFKDKGLLLYQTLGIKQYEILKKLENEIF